MALEIGVDSFTSLADANTYWTEHSGGTGWATASDTEKEKALREASQFIDKSYSWLGNHPGGESQLLSWPRLNVIDRQGRYRSSGKVPKEIKDATAWLAEQALGGQLRPAKDRGGEVSRLKAGSVEIQYAEGAPSNKSFDYVDLLVSELVSHGKGSTKLLKS